MEERKIGYDRSRLLDILAELREARTEFSVNKMSEHARLVSLAITDLESADNWLLRAMAAPIADA